MKKLKWKYDQKNKQWWVNESAAYANDGFVITKFEDGGYNLYSEWLKTDIPLIKFKDAKLVAELINDGVNFELEK